MKTNNSLKLTRFSSTHVERIERTTTATVAPKNARTFFASSLLLVAMMNAAWAEEEYNPATENSQLGKGVRLEASSGFIDVTTGHAAPYVIDFDGDGVRDLLVGEFGGGRFDSKRLPPTESAKPYQYCAGKLRIYKNLGTNTNPRFEKFEYLRAKNEDASVPITCCISFCPHFVDYEGDGDLDIISGSYPGEVYLFVKDADGTYQQGVYLKDDDGKPIPIKSHSNTAELHDFDGDGDLDLLIASRMGSMVISENIGTRTKPSYGKPKELTTRRGYSVTGTSAHYADWDHDGIRDLIVGTESGDVYWYKNIGADNKPVFDKHQMLIDVQQYGFKKFPRETGAKYPGDRTKVHVTDWNGDGRVDLLIGDYVNLTYTLNPLNEKEKQELAILETKVNEAIKEWKEMSIERSRFSPNPVPEEFLTRYADCEKRMHDLFKSKRPYQRDLSEPHGYVWLYLRDGQAPKAAITPPAGKNQMQHVALKASATPGENQDTFEVSLRLSIDPGWHIDSQAAKSKENKATTASIKLSAGFEQVGEFAIQRDKSVTQSENADWLMHEVVFTTKVRRQPGMKGQATATVSVQLCNDDVCLPAGELTSTIDF